MSWRFAMVGHQQTQCWPQIKVYFLHRFLTQLYWSNDVISKTQWPTKSREISRHLRVNRRLFPRPARWPLEQGPQCLPDESRLWLHRNISMDKIVTLVRSQISRIPAGNMADWRPRLVDSKNIKHNADPAWNPHIYALQAANTISNIYIYIIYIIYIYSGGNETFALTTYSLMAIKRSQWRLLHFC